MLGGKGGRCSGGWRLYVVGVLTWLASLPGTGFSNCRRVSHGQCSSTVAYGYPDSYPPLVSMASLVKNKWVTGYNPVALRPVGRANHAAATILLHVDNETVEETMLVFGGVSDRDDFASQTWLYQPKRNAWLMLEVEHLTPRFGHTLITGPSGEYVLLFGGCAVDSQAESLGHFVFYDMSWKQIEVNTSDFPDRFLHSTVILPHYHSKTVRSLPAGDGGLRTTTTERRVFVFGGSLCQEKEGFEVDELWELHYDSTEFPGVSGGEDVLQWSHVNITGIRPSPRAGHVGVSTPFDTMLIFSGFYNSTVLTDLWEFFYNTFENQWMWKSLPSLPISASKMRSCNSVVGVYVDLENSVIMAFACTESSTLSLWSYLYLNSTWQFLEPVGIQAPLPLAFPSMAVVDEQLLVFGGRTPYGLSSVDVWAFVERASFSMWAIQPEPVSYPQPRALHAAAFCPVLDIMFIVGGFRIDLQPPGVLQPAVLADNVVWQWNASFDRWTQQPVPHGFQPRIAATAQIIAGYLVVFGGINGASESLDDTWLVGTTDLRWRQSGSRAQPGRRGAHTMVSYGRFAVVFGGLDTGTESLLNDVWYYDVAADDWELKAHSSAEGAIIPARFGHGAAVIDHYMYVFGGVVDDGGVPQDNNRLWRYDLRNHFWQVVSGDSMAMFFPGTRFFASFTAVGKKLVLLGGCTAYSSVTLFPSTWYTQLPILCWNDLDQNTLDLAFVFDTTKITADESWNYRGEWTYPLQLKNPPPMYMQHTTVELAGRLIVYGGISYEYLYNESSGAGQKWIVSVGCDSGYHSVSFGAATCQRCPVGSYSTQPGQTRCERCPNSTFTRGTGSTSLSNCSLCDAKQYCHDHGDCVVENSGREVRASCQCHFGFSSSDRCNLPLYYMIGGSGAVVVIIVVLLSYVLIKYRQKRTAEQEKVRLLRTSRQEIAELSNAWLIDLEEITLKHRIDKEFPGSFGQVHLAEYRGFQVAVKKLGVALGSTESRLFERELETMRAIRHPNIVLFLGGGHMVEKENRPLPFIVMEYMARGTLRQILASSTVSVDHAQQLRFALDISKGLRFLHSLSPPRIHRDLKSTNLLVSDRWVVKVSDFGSAARFDMNSRHVQSALSRRLSSIGGDDHVHSLRSPEQETRNDGHSLDADESTPLLHTQAPLSSRVGTVAWSAPELLSKSSYGASVDVYSFGIVLWEICTRCVPFEEYPFTTDVRNAVLSGVRPPVPSSCSAAYSTLMQECWHGEHMERPTSAEIVPQLDEQLEMCLSSHIDTRASSASASPGRPSSALTIQ